MKLGRDDKMIASINISYSKYVKNMLKIEQKFSVEKKINLLCDACLYGFVLKSCHPTI